MNVAYYTPSEVALHNKRDDLWVSLLGRVYNVTPLMIHDGSEEEERRCKVLIAHAGKDISNLFDPDTHDFKRPCHPLAYLFLNFFPHGPLPETKEQVPSSLWEPYTKLHWWHPNSVYMVGLLTKQARHVRIINTCSGQQHMLNICIEDKLSRILERELTFNAHVRSYTWKFEGRVLDMDKTMAENHVPDFAEDLNMCGLHDDEYTPALMLYFNDDLTEM